jgi:biotin carboxyl carrier protein
MSRITRHRLELDDQRTDVTVERVAGTDAVTVTLGERKLTVRLLAGSDAPLLLVGDRVVALARSSNGSSGSLAWNGRAHAFRELRAGAPAQPRARAASGVVSGPMPGRVVEVHVKPGDEVSAGAPLVVIEAMKMQNALFAPGPGRVERVHVAVGANIERGAPLVELSLRPPAGAP